MFTYPICILTSCSRDNFQHQVYFSNETRLMF
jgi:hypothetical protein